MQYKNAIACSLLNAMADDPSVLLLGCGVANDPYVFGTTKPAHDTYPERVLETPISEAAMAGMCAGLAIEGYRPVLTLARADWLTLCMEALVNTAAKWRWTHGKGLPLVVRALVGRGWGQGPMHSQNLGEMLAQVPGLKVLMPTSAWSYKAWFKEAIQDDTPAIILEPRRLYDLEDITDFPIDRDADIVIYTVGDSVLDAVDATRTLNTMGHQACVFPIENLSLGYPCPCQKGCVHRFDYEYGCAILVDSMPAFGGVLSEMEAKLRAHGITRVARITPPFTPCPASASLERAWYPTADAIVQAACKFTGDECATINYPRENEAEARKEPF